MAGAVIGVSLRALVNFGGPTVASSGVGLGADIDANKAPHACEW